MPSKTLPPPSAWQVQLLRLSSFRTPLFKIEAPTWWADLLDTPPDEVTSRPKEGLYLESGTVEERKLSLQIQPERIDWTLTPLDPTGAAPITGLPSLGSFPVTLASFMDLMLRWLPVCPPANRLAFGCVLFQPAENRQAGYLQTAQYLDGIVTLDPENSSDFFYQINRPRPSGTGLQGLRINRLSRWSVLLFEGFRLVLSKAELTSQPYAVQQSACRLELDVNTVPESFGPELPREALAKVLQELVAVGEEIARSGDIP